MKWFKKKEKKYFIYITFGETKEYDYPNLGLDNLTFKQAEAKFDEIKEKVEEGEVEVYIMKSGLPRIINWANLQDCYIEEI